MKKLFHLLIPSFTMVLASCNSSTSGSDDRKYEVMTLYGGWEARVDETRTKVRSIESQYTTYLRYEFDSLDRNVFDSPYPYWDKIYVYLDKKGIRKAELYSNPAKSYITEEFYFAEGILIYAQVESDGIRKEERDSTFRGEQYFFTKQTLVLALDTKGKRRDITDDSVKIKGVDLAKEAEQIKKIIAEKQIKP